MVRAAREAFLRNGNTSVPDTEATPLNFAKPIAGKITRGEVTLAIQPATTKPPKPNDRRCVKTHNKGPIICHVIITDVDTSLRAGDVTFKQTRAAGYRTTDAWRAAWVRRYDHKWIDAQEITTAEDGTVDVNRWMTDDDLIPRFAAKHAQRAVMAVRFALSVDEPRFLADQRVSHRGAHDDGQYTGNRARAIDDLEVIDEVAQKRYAEKAAREGELQRASFRRDLEAERARRKAERGRSMRLPPYQRRAA